MPGRFVPARSEVSRHGVLDAEAGKYHGQNLADIDATGRHRAYETAGTRFDADRGAAYSCLLWGARGAGVMLTAVRPIAGTVSAAQWLSGRADFGGE